MTGWIKMHRQIMEHWIWEDPKKLKWWLEILLLTNHSDKKTMIGGKIVTIERGTFHTSELKLSEKWNVSRNTVRKFLKLLESDGMITTNRTQNGTTIEVCNYNVFQGFLEEKKQQSEQRNEQQNEQRDIQQSAQLNEQKKDNGLNTTKELKNYKELENVKNVVVEPNQKNDFAEVINLYQRDIQATPPLTVINKLSDDFDMFGKEIMLYAIEKSAIAGNRDYKFIDYLTKEWRKQQLRTLEAVEQYENKRNQPKQINNFSNERNGVTNIFGDRQDLSFQALELKKEKSGIASFTEEEYKAYERYYL